MSAARGADALIVGGGIQGLSTAVHLALRGVQVLVLEKNFCGRHASGVNAGGVNRIGRYPEELPLSGLALELWHRIAELVDDGCGFEASGRIKVAESEAELETLHTRFQRVRDLGHQHERWLDAKELRELEPGLAGHCTGGLVSPGCGHANPMRTVQAFRRKAQPFQEIRILPGTYAESVYVNDTTLVLRGSIPVADMVRIAPASDKDEQGRLLLSRHYCTGSLANWE